MKLPKIERHAFITLCIGIIIGTGVGMYLFAFAIPQMIANNTLLSGANFTLPFEDELTKEEMKQGRGMTEGKRGRTNLVIENEESYLQAMVRNRTEAIKMSEDVLTLSPNDKVKQLANQVIVNQTEEISMINSWLKN